VIRPATSISVISTSCRFPDAASPTELWRNALEGRRSFRAIPPQRLDIARYSAETIGEADSITHIRAGLLTNWSFDRARFRIPEKTFAATDLTHWLALELAAESIDRMGGPETLDRTRTAVVVANTLAGEFSRAGLLRLRLPFLADILEQASDAEGLPDEAAAGLRQRFVGMLRSHFPEPNEDSLAGGLANTIAGRIANHFDLRGGAYSVDGACASSLVAVADAANLLVSGQADVVLVVAVDLSLDPFELVGFSRNGALAANEMRVFDKRVEGFWPGEGGACAVLMREKDARRRELPALANILGWGLSTDGSGGLTRPSSEGQLSAYRRAYEMAEVDPADIAFVEAHGTGTAVGDPIEVRALAALCEGARSPLRIGSIKANIGHTKAAAGFAGLIKAIEALRHGVLPPHVGCQTPHPVFAEVGDVVRPALICEPIEDCRAAIAGVSSFGFGGINAHVVIQRAESVARPSVLPKPPVTQETELFLFSGARTDEIVARIVELEQRAPGLSMAELTDSAAQTASALRYGSIRVAVIASNGADLADRLCRARESLLTGDSSLAHHDDIFVGRTHRAPRIGFIFPGQAAPCRPDGGIWRRRFSCAADLDARLPSFAGSGNDPTATNVAQPVIVASSLQALRVLRRLGITADIAAGHSLGEITALAWAGVLSEDAAIDLAQARGSIMAQFGLAGGAMLRVMLSAEEAGRLFGDCGTVVACQNGRFETVIAGSVEAIAVAAKRCAARNIEASRLSVSHAFHSPDMEPATIPLGKVLKTFRLKAAEARVISTITGAPLEPESALPQLLIDQLTRPVLFDRALDQMAAETDILVEVGPGRGLTRLARDRGLTAMSVDALADRLQPLLATAGALFVAGVDVRTDALFEDRNVRAFDPAALSSFIDSPCGSRSAGSAVERVNIAPAIVEQVECAVVPGEPLAMVLSIVAAETGLDISGFGADDRFLDAFHLNSLAVARIVRTAAKALNARVPSVPTEFANATPRLLAEALVELREFGDDIAGEHQRIAGVRNWIRTYGMQWQTACELGSSPSSLPWSRTTIGQSMVPACEPDVESGLLILIDRPFEMEAAEALVALVANAAKAGIAHLALCHSGLPVAGFALSVASERHFRSVRVVDRAQAGADHPHVDALLSAEIEGYYEVRIAENERLETPTFAPSPFASSSVATITADDVVVIVGGGKGIAAECALRLSTPGPVVILVGRSPADDPDVTATLDRARRKRLRCRYVRADVLDSATLIEGLGPVISEFGPATVLIYAPAVNEPKRLTDLDAATIRKTLAPKTLGLESTLRAVGPQLRRLVTFGSIIGRIGLEGESHYALANAMQTLATETWASAAPNRAALAIEWSLWGGAGMGERLGTIERLDALGVDALSVDDALDAFDRLLDAKGAVVVTSRFGAPPSLSLGVSGLPMLRFIDETKIHFPGVELVVETSLSYGRDPYLEDHAIDGLAVLPGVMGLEAMAQIASALILLGDHIAVSNIAFARAVHVAAEADLRIRIAGLRTADATVDVCLFAEDDGFAIPCMRATFSTELADRASLDPQPASQIFPATPLYGSLFFGSGRFRRLEHFEIATSRHVSARLRPDEGKNWFGSYESGRVVLWDPGSADATLHALQVTIPHKRVLPVTARRIEIDRSAGAPVHVRAVEMAVSADAYTFDVLATDAKGRTAYRWTNVTFRAVGRIDISPVLSEVPLLGRSYLERVAREALGDETIEVALIHDGSGSRKSRRAAVLRELDLDGTIESRGDGRPLRSDGRGSISLAHGDAVSLAVIARDQVSCDIEANHGERLAGPDEIRGHVGFEVCRKLGRKPYGAFRAAKPDTVTVIDDVLLMMVDLPTPSGPHTVGFGRVKHPNAIPLQQFALLTSGAVP
jgi:enediyne polyketide synthase